MVSLLIMLVMVIVIGVPIALVVLITRVSELRRRVERLQVHVDVMRFDAERVAAASTAAAGAQAASAPAAAPGPAPASAPEPAPAPASAPEPVQAPMPVFQERVTTAETRAPDQPRAFDPYNSTPRERSAPRLSPTTRAAPEPSGPEQMFATIWRWFTEGNVPVKVGMVVLFAGVGALLKYATDQGWMSFPIEWRLTGIALVAIVGLAFGWRQRARRRVFALSLQGGAIGVLLMTSFAAFKLYALLPPLPAVTIWVVLAAAAGALAVWQEARALAVLGILAGFMAPVLMSTGSGNHVAVFSFYAVLNAAIFGVAWRRSWRELNLLGFACTFGIATWWGVLAYSPDKFGTTLPFLLLFFAFYALIPVIHSRRGSGVDGDLAEASLVFGTPLISFALLAGLLEGDQRQLAGSALALAGIYAVLAWQTDQERAPLLRRAHWVLAWGFATLSVPLALSAQATASVFALEGAAMVWFGLAQSRLLTRLAGAALQGVAALCLVDALDGVRPEMAFANAAFTGSLLLSLAGFACAWCHDRAGRAGTATVFFVWGLLWWLVMGGREIDQFVAGQQELDALLGFTALTAGAAALFLRQHLIRELGWTVAAAVAAAIPLAIGQSVEHQHPFAGSGLAAWGLFAVLGAYALRRLREHADASVGWAHAAWLLAWPLAATIWLREAGRDAELAAGWIDAAMVLPWLIVGAAMLLRSGLVVWPLAERFAEWRKPVITACMAIVAGMGALLLTVPGDARPLPWVPLLNPVELSLAASLVLLIGWRRGDGGARRLLQGRAPVISIVLLLVITSVTLRAVHQLGAVPWSRAMFDSALAQASLSLVWSVLGVAGWIAGSRRRHRGLWQVGAVLMGIVLVKLVLVDRIHLGNLPGIASFIGYGLLCTLVGYLAPAPPREAVPAEGKA